MPVSDREKVFQFGEVDVRVGAEVVGWLLGLPLGVLVVGTAVLLGAVAVGVVVLGVDADGLDVVLPALSFESPHPVSPATAAAAPAVSTVRRSSRLTIPQLLTRGRPHGRQRSRRPTRHHLHLEGRLMHE